MIVSYVQNMETQITLCEEAGLWQYISSPRGWPSEDEAGNPRRVP